MIKLGIDLDNTIICYDNLIHDLAKKKFKKINFGQKIKSKKFIKNKIIKFYGNDQWTKLQGIIYGKKILHAKIFDGFKDEILKLREEFDIFIISHKTKKAAIGKNINLRTAAKKFLKKNDISFCKNEIIDQNKILFTETKREKIDIIKNKKIDIFVDDLDDILKKIPKNIKKIHFSKKKNKFKNIYKWSEITKELLKKKKILLRNKIKNIINSDLIITKKISSGTNNELYIIKIKKKKYVLKIYKNKKQDLSYLKEVKFLEKFKKLKEIPSLKIKNNHYKFVIIKFVPGKKIIKLKIKDIKKIIFFIKKIQYKIGHYRNIKDTKLRYATDRIWNENDIFVDIKKRIIKTNIRLNSNINEDTLITKINAKIKHKLKQLRKKISLLKLNLNQSNFECLSPSDFNIRNIIRSSKNFYFIDFEYSGIDNYLKLILDFICQPDIKFKKNEVDFIINEFSKINYKIKYNFDKSLLILNSIKWFYIILNSNYYDKYDKSQIKKSIDYFNNRISKELD